MEWSCGLVWFKDVEKVEKVEKLVFFFENDKVTDLVTNTHSPGPALMQ